MKRSSALLRSLFFLAVFTVVPGCVFESENDDIGTLTQEATVTSLSTDCYVCNDGCIGDSCEGGSYQRFGDSDDCTLGDGPQTCNSEVTQVIDLGTGEAAYLSLFATATSTVNEVGPDSLQVYCDKAGTTADDEIHTGQNHPGGNVEKVMTTRILLLGPGVFTCDGTALVGRDEIVGYHVFKAGSTKTRLSRADVTAGWRWGTEYEETQGTEVQYGDECCTESNQSTCCRQGDPGDPDGDGINCVDLDGTGHCRREETKPCSSNAQCTAQPYAPGIYIGPQSLQGTSEYVLHHPSRFSVPMDAPRLDVYSEIQLTGCPKWSVSCPTYREGSVAGVGTSVRLRLYVQQMCSSTSSTVAKTTIIDQPFSITATEHHKKAHLVANDVTFATASTACEGGVITGRSFKVKTLVTWLSDANVKVEYGDNGRKGYSTSFAFPDY